MMFSLEKKVEEGEVDRQERTTTACCTEVERILAWDVTISHYKLTGPSSKLEASVPLSTEI